MKPSANWTKCFASANFFLLNAPHNDTHYTKMQLALQLSVVFVSNSDYKELKELAKLLASVTPMYVEAHLCQCV